MVHVDGTILNNDSCYCPECYKKIFDITRERRHTFKDGKIVPIRFEDCLVAPVATHVAEAKVGVPKISLKELKRLEKELLG